MVSAGKEYAITEEPDELTAVRPRQLAPGCERIRCAPDRRFGRGSIRPGDTGDLLARDRRANDEIARLDPCRVDTEPF